VIGSSTARYSYLRPSGLRPSGIRAVRLGSGLVLFSYIALHLLNHSLGNVSLLWMEHGLAVQRFIWQGLLGSIALYLSLIIHFMLGLLALYERRWLHWTPRELAQVVLGLCVPPLLANHLTVTRIAFAEFGVNKGYAQELYSFWIASPGLGKVQLALLLVAWTHGCLGIAFWLRVKPWFERWNAPLLSIAVLLPVLALLGYLQAGREVVDLARDPNWLAMAITPATNGTLPQSAWLASLRNAFLVFDGAALGVVLLARGIRLVNEQLGGRIRISYPDGRRQWVPLGFSVLEASQLARIPHASICGGRARCTLCRVRVLGPVTLPPPDEPERRVLARMGADPSSIRLACQLRPRCNLSVLPIVTPDAQTSFLQRRQSGMTPREHRLVFMFIDMRDSTSFAEKRMPYDSIFVLGRFIATISAAVVAAGGVPNQFLGDGIMAIFGLNGDLATACRQALIGAQGVARNIRLLSEVLEHELRGPIRFGIGVHCGETIAGEIGFRDHVTFTALGDAPNVASRLQQMTKDLACEALISETVFTHAGLSGDPLPVKILSLRGRATTIPAYVLHHVEADMTTLLSHASITIREEAVNG
jgi:adenylate cyclase